MVLEKIDLINFRLHENTGLQLSENLNFIIGGNGQGKTSILEAIYYLCTSRSINQSADSEAVSFDKKFFELNGLFSDTNKNKCRIFFELDTNKKNYFLDDKQIYRASSVVGKFPVVTLTPADHSLTLGSPSDRRKFVDSVISQSSGTYLAILLEYNKTLKQRSQLLSRIRERRSENLLKQLDAWTATLAKNGAEIIRHRKRFLEEFDVFVRETYIKLMGSTETPSIEYSTINGLTDAPIEERLLQLLNELRGDEIARAQNLIGPHRDDFVFMINNLNLKKFGSQGQHKTFQIALRFGQFFYMKEKAGKVPVFLMDDVFGELDSFRAGKISEYLREVGQAFITMTDMSNSSYLRISESDLVMNVHKGEVSHAS